MKKSANFVPQMATLGKLIAVIMVSGLVACSGKKAGSSLSTEKFEEQLLVSNAQLVDVRSPKDFDQGHISQARNVDVDGPTFELTSGNLYKDIPVFVYGKGGSETEAAAEKLRDAGFLEVYELEGGMEQWKKQNKPVEQGFNSAIAGKKLVLVDFNATWCKPCKMMQPFVDRIHDERKDVVTVMSIDTDVEQGIAMEYQVTALPTVMLFRDNKVLYRSEGYRDHAYLDSIVTYYK